MRSLATRVARLEVVAGTGFAPSEQEFQRAEALLGRHAKVGALKILFETDGFEPDIDPNEQALMMIAEKSGQIEEAREIKRHYWRARGIDIDEKERRYIEESMARLREIFGDVPEDEASDGTSPVAAGWEPEC